MQNGIEIWMNHLNTVEIAEDGKTAKIGGGTLTKTVTDSLWPVGKQTGASDADPFLMAIFNIRKLMREIVTGACECTSILGPGLGGGHGYLQGHHGLVQDQFVSMNIVFADGTLQTIDEESAPDLWWAMRGAGHNFGIVTSVTSKIYDIEHPDWAYQSFTFTGDKVEALYHAINDHQLKNGTQPVDVVNYGFFFNSPDIDPNGPLIAFYILQEGVTAVDPFYTTPFLDLDPIATDAAGGKYTDLARWTSNSNESPPCQKVGLVNTRFPIDLAIYNTEAMRKAYDLFASVTQQTPALNGSLFLYEGYSLQGVQAIPSESTAYPYRDDTLLLAPLIIYPPGGPELEKTAAKLGEDMRQILYEGSGRSELHTYVNYAFGDESKQSMYGYEQWRQDRLLSLKNKYDPERKFSFYAPIA